MSKYLLEDMVKTKRLKKGNIKIEPEVKKTSPTIVTPPRQEKIINIDTNYNKKRPRRMLWFVALISVVFCFFALSFLFSRAEITVNPKIKEIKINENFSAGRDSNNNSLFFNLVVIPGREDKTIEATGEKDVSLKATGTVVIFNNFSSSPQILAVDTRLEGSNGKIYKTQTKTTVPGKYSGGAPGQVEVKIYADSPGTDYNSPPLDFNIVGFKGTPKYGKFYGRSKGEITDGFVGKAPDISTADKVSATAELKAVLQAKLLQNAINQIPDGFVLFKDATFLNTNNEKNEPNVYYTYNNDNSMTLSLKGTLYGFLFNEQKLTEKIASGAIDKYDESSVYVPNIRDLNFKLASGDSVSFGDVKNIDFNLSGNVKIVWKLDTDKFIADLSGKSKKDFNQILSQYENIDSASLTLSPMWKMSIPDQAKNIKVIVNYPE